MDSLNLLSYFVLSINIYHNQLKHIKYENCSLFTNSNLEIKSLVNGVTATGGRAVCVASD